MFRARLSVSARFMLVLGIGLVFQAGISAVSLFHLRKTLIDARTAEVKHLLETAYSTVDFYHEQSVKGLLTDAQARQAAIDAVRAMRYGDNNYYFIWAMDGTGVAHGSHPEWEGHNVLQSPDKERWPVTSYMVARLIEVCKTPQKEGVAHYKIPKKGGTVPLDKIAYTRLFEPWGWSIGTGAYVDDIDATFRAQAVIILAIFAGLIGLASLVSFILARDLARALVRLSRCVARVAKGDFEGDVPGIDRRDEVGLMARALLVFRDNSREVLELRLDQLTGLPNRKLLMDRIKQSMNSSTRNGSYCGIMLIDMDKFKALNDSQGHDIGDMLLHEVARRLSVCIRPGDIVARLGGDEFVALLVDLGAREDEAASVIETLAERILHALSQTYHFGHIHHDTSASIGIALFKGQACAAEELLKQADLAMYKAKQMGRNASRFFDPLMEAAVHERATLEADLRLALFKNQFELYYQPLIGKGRRPYRRGSSHPLEPPLPRPRAARLLHSAG